jgi:hypothetical protein
METTSAPLKPADARKMARISMSPLTNSVEELNAVTDWFFDPSRSEASNKGTFVVVVDDFYDEPDAVRDLALQQDFVRYSPPSIEQVGPDVADQFQELRGTWLSTALFVFMGQPVRHPIDGFAYRPMSLLHRLTDVVGERILLDTWESGGDGWNGVFHLIGDDWAVGRGNIHHHYKPGDVERGWSGLVYLSPDAIPSAGTSIWRDRRTGGCIAAYGAKFERDENNFEMALLIENRYNRLVLFRESVLHRVEHGFGHGKDSRLTQTFFFRTAVPSPTD